MQGLNFDKVQKIYNQCEMAPLFREKMADIISSNFASRISQTTSKEIGKKSSYFLVIAPCQSQ